jgi:hypothetical protein
MANRKAVTAKELPSLWRRGNATQLQVMKRLTKRLSGHDGGDLRRKQFRELYLALVIGLLMCVIIGVLLYLVNQQGRI